MVQICRYLANRVRPLSFRKARFSLLHSEDHAFLKHVHTAKLRQRCSKTPETEVEWRTHAT